MHFTDKKVSVIVPTFNPGDYIYECFNSIKKQSLSSSLFELIVVLNGDKEPYFSSLSTYLATSGIQYKLEYTSSPGVSNARNIGIEKSQYPYICFVDDDDVLSPKYLESLLANADEEVLSICNIKAFINTIENSSTGFFLSEYLHNYPTGHILKPGFLTRSILSVPVAKLFPKQSIGNRKYNCKINNGEDSLFVTTISNKIKSLVVCDSDAVYYVRLRKGSASRHRIPIHTLAMQSMYLFYQYTKLFFVWKPGYSYMLLFSRYIGVIKNMFVLLKNT